MQSRGLSRLLNSIVINDVVSVVEYTLVVFKSAETAMIVGMYYISF